MSEKIVRQAEIHIQLRWVGAPLLCSGAFLLLWAVQNFSITGFFPIALGVACSLMGLTCFGINHDTAISLAMQAQREDDTAQLSEQLRMEVEEEISRGISQTLSLQANPILAKVLPLIVCLVQLVEAYLLFGK